MLIMLKCVDDDLYRTRLKELRMRVKAASDLEIQNRSAHARLTAWGRGPYRDSGSLSTIHLNVIPHMRKSSQNF